MEQLTNLVVSEGELANIARVLGRLALQDRAGRPAEEGVNPVIR